MKRHAWLFALSGLVLTACSGSSSSDGGTNLQNFVGNVIANTSDATEPIPINGITFELDEDPDAFDELFLDP